MKKLSILIVGFIVAFTCEAQTVQKTVTMSLSAETINSLNVNAASGFLIIEGDQNASSIQVRADIELNGVDEKKMDRYIILKLEERGDNAFLKSDIDSKWKLLGQNIYGKIDLTVTVPANLALDIDDGSGNINISSIASTISVNDGSGSQEVVSIGGDLDINDGSGSIDLKDVDGSVEMNDGSGSVIISGVSGSVKIDDGSGSIVAKRVGGDITINDGSGNIDIVDAGGSVTLSDGSGNINVMNVGEDVIVKSSGSGGTQFKNIAGRVINN